MQKTDSSSEPSILQTRLSPLTEVFGEVFKLNFCYDGEQFINYVTIGVRQGLSTFIIRYTSESEHSVENIIEIFPLIQSESEPLLWYEINNEEGQSLIKNNLACAIGDTLENGASNTCEHLP